MFGCTREESAAAVEAAGRAAEAAGEAAAARVKESRRRELQAGAAARAFIGPVALHTAAIALCLSAAACLMVAALVRIAACMLAARVWRESAQ